MTQLILSIIAETLILAFAGVWIVKKQPQKNGRELVIVSEIPETAIMGGMLIVISYVLLIFKIKDPTMAGTDENATNFVSFLALLCAISGCEIILLTFVKKVIAYPDKFVEINSFGLTREFTWNSVSEIKTTPLSLRVTLKTDGESVSINGRAKEYGQFLHIAKDRIPAIVGSDTLGHLYKRVTKQGLLKL